MKKIIPLSILLFVSYFLPAQEITTMWPYHYPEFKDGTVYLKNERTLVAPLNVHLLKSSLHYLDQDKIKEVTSSDIVVVRISDDTYYVRNNQLMRVVEGDSTGFLAELELADFGALRDGGGAYGSSSNVQAVRRLSSLEIGGINITNHMELNGKKDEGELLPLDKTFYLVTPDRIFLATKKGIESELTDAQKKAFRKFTKERKIKWKNTESLYSLLDFLKTLPEE